jgi:hypothetical protein
MEQPRLPEVAAAGDHTLATIIMDLAPSIQMKTPYSEG